MAAQRDDFSVKTISPKLGGERGARNPNGPTSSHDLVGQMEFLYVEVIQAINNSSKSPRGCPMVEIILGNYKSSTQTLPIGPNMDWNQVFAFDKSKGDVLSVVLSVFVYDTRLQITTKTVIGKRNFKLAADIPGRTPPDARIAPQWYSMKDTETGYHMDLLMSVWFGTQVDEVYSQAWFSDAFEVSASCVINTRPKLYIAPRLCYVRVTIVSAYDLIPTDNNRIPSVYVKATLGRVALKTLVSSGSNPSWNQDLIFVVSEPLEGTLYIELIDQVDDQHEQCIGRLKKKLSEMTTLKVPGSAPVLFYDFETPVKVERAGDSRRFASRIKMKLAIDQAYHVADECIQYSSDYRAYAKGLWPVLLGKLEIGILSATGLKVIDERKKGIDSYVVAKYGNRWARTRTIVDSSSPKWNEQYSWDVYDKCTVLTLGVYDNRQISNENYADDVPIGKVRIPLHHVQYNRIYTYSCPVLCLGRSGLKKMGEIQLAIRCASVAPLEAEYTAPLRWMLPKAHFKSPLSVYQIEELRVQAVEMNCMNLAKTEPPLRSEVVLDMLKPRSKRFSMRRIRANVERFNRFFRKWYNLYDSVASVTRYSPCVIRKLIAFFIIGIFLSWPVLIWWLAFSVILLRVLYLGLVETCKLLNRKMKRIQTSPPPPPLFLMDLKLWNLDSPNFDELEEEFDSSVSDVNVLRMRYDRLKKISAQGMLLVGDAASQFERLDAVLTSRGAELASFYFGVFCLLALLFIYFCTLWGFAITLSIYWLNFPCFRNDLPTGIKNFFRRLPTNEEMI